MALRQRIEVLRLALIDDQHVARLVLPVPEKEALQKVDWAAQREAIWGNRVFSALEAKEMDDYEEEREGG